MTIVRRKRRIAADEAHSWARNLRLKNPYAKLVLCMLTLYVNGEGSCFVSIAQLAEDCEFAAETVRRRLVWLESVGAIVRMPQWRDENGRLNGEGRGKRTTDDIRLMIDSDPETIEAAAQGDSEPIEESSNSEEAETSHPPLRVAKSELAPLPATQQPSHCVRDITSEPEPEESHPTPSGGLSLEGWKDFENDWGEPILRQSIAQQVWSALKPDERDLARRAARGYGIWLRQQKRPPTRLAAQRFLRERDAWAKFAELAIDPQSGRPTGGISSGSVEGRAVIMLHAVAGIPRPFEGRHGIVYSGAITPQLLALAQATDDWIDLNHQQDGAWQSFLKASISTWRPRHIGRAPWPWPPKQDGTIYTATGPPPALPASDETEDEMAEHFK